jgi:hypothetical protein
MTNRMTFGFWLKQRRSLLDLTQQGLAARSDCSVDTIRKIEAIGGALRGHWPRAWPQRCRSQLPSRLHSSSSRVAKAASMHGSRMRSNLRKRTPNHESPANSLHHSHR